MNLEVGVLEVAFAAYFADVGTIPGMRPLMPLEVAGVLEGLAANLAGVGEEAVGSQVGVENTPVGKFFIADMAGEGLLGVNGLDVALEGVLVSQGLVAQPAVDNGLVLLPVHVQGRWVREGIRANFAHIE